MFELFKLKARHLQDCSQDLSLCSNHSKPKGGALNLMALLLSNEKKNCTPPLEVGASASVHFSAVAWLLPSRFTTEWPCRLHNVERGKSVFKAFTPFDSMCDRCFLRFMHFSITAYFPSVSQIVHCFAAILHGRPRGFFCERFNLFTKPKCA